ncbi:unnamed protein product, partial [Ixodes hexagonus]
FVSCTKGVVYQIPFSCGKIYIGQTGRWLNVRLREHRSSLAATACSHLALHCRDCFCQPLLEKAVVLFRHKDQKAREIVEALNIRKGGSSCVSQASLALLDSEVEYL